MGTQGKLQGRRERGVHRTRATEDAAQRRPACPWSYAIDSRDEQQQEREGREGHGYRDSIHDHHYWTQASHRRDDSREAYNDFVTTPGTCHAPPARRRAIW